MQGKLLHINVDQLRLTANLYGDANHPLVILLHGFPDTPRSWDQVYPELVHAGYQVLVPWLRGYTLESVNKNAHYGIASAASDVRAWLQSLNISTCHLVGHDWGAAIAMAYASQHPEHLKSISLLAVPPIPEMQFLYKAISAMPKQLLMSSYMLLMQSKIAPYLLAKNQAKFVENIWKEWSPTWQFSEQDFAATRQIFKQRQIAWAATRYYRNLFAIHQRKNLTANQQLFAPIAVPTLALAGLDDGCMNIKLHRTLAKSQYFQADLNTAYLQDCGHFLQAEQPFEVAAHLLQHFQANSAFTN
ncbi:alpha/beta fold hydrolase [Acinetobacter sp. Marseille-Q1618]|uniref:alpha/beta fold hydrolase n=1 Tax=Acinetobacter sp. Marseille-Q1618 TaxID=2697502 RepID=UPI00156EFE9B|nr:alpha/beta hydrolase [Acinetobacter sp. Marseille-Q1618]